MTKHMTGTRDEWLAARLELLEAEKKFTRHGDELARRRRALPWVRIDKTYRFANHDVTLSAVSRTPLAKLQAYKRRMGWTFPWASSLGSGFNFDFNVAFTAEQQREGAIEYNYRRGAYPMDATQVPKPVAEFAATCGTDAPTYSRERPGLSAFVLEDGVLYHSYSTYARTGRPLGHVPVAGPSAERTQRGGAVVPPP